MAERIRHDPQECEVVAVELVADDYQDSAADESKTHKMPPQRTSVTVPFVRQTDLKSVIEFAGAEGVRWKRRGHVVVVLQRAPLESHALATSAEDP